MQKMIHLAAQYLATCGISFVDKKEDDSHTNLGLDIESGKLSARPLTPKGDLMTFNYNTFSLEWKSTTNSQTLNLDGKTHKEVFNWVKAVTEKATGKEYRYSLHYDLPYSASDDFLFRLEDASEMKELLRLRILAQQSMQEVVEEHKLDSEIRIWPHHFDTGVFAPLSKESPISIGIGMAIPDSVADQHYFYISGYKGHEGIDTSKFSDLSKGEWKWDGFKGGILPAKGIALEETIQFFKEAIEHYKAI